MTGLEIPETGLSLRPGDQPGDAAAKPAQFMRLNLAQNTLDELISSLQSDDSTAKVRLGKHPTLHYDNKTQSFHAYPETHRSEIYHTSDDKQNLYFTGVLSHSLEVEKAREATAATDQALANLEESLNAFERGKASKSTHMIQNPDELKALRAANSGSVVHRGSKPKSVLEKDRLIRNANNRSLTSSPTLGPPRSPLPGMTPTSAPASQAKNNARLQALKTPLVHLLAIRPVSTKFLARQTRSTIEDCTVLVQKYGTENRIDREKYDLKDKFYKDLDVWKFPYPTQDDRQAAIDKAISAFDRMRLSRTDKLWQGLLPKEERGKGKCLSKLNLQSGLQSGLAGKKPSTPRMTMDGADDRKDGDTTGNETDRPRGTPAVVAKKSSTPAAKARTEKEPAKGPAKNKNTNSTLTGRITKKTGGRPPGKAATETKYKSAEFVHDSDESDDEMPDASPPPAPARAPSPPPAPTPTDRPKQAKSTTVTTTTKKTAPVKKSTQVSTKPRPKEDTPAAPTPKVPKAEVPTPKLEPTKTAAKRPPSARPSTSPQKPSPLSSPPASASDAPNFGRSDSQNQSSSSSSSSPLISQLGRAKAKSAVSTLSNSTRPAGTSKGGSASVNPLKRKAEPERPVAPTPIAARATNGNNDLKRRRAVSTSSGGSTGSASPPMSHKVAQRRLWDKSQRFKRAYAKYHSLHESLAGQANPRPESITKLEGWHEQLTQMKNEIWEEDRKLRDGSYA
jgi:RNA polymerase II elongation factor ELL